MASKFEPWNPSNVKNHFCMSGISWTGSVSGVRFHELLFNNQNMISLSSTNVHLIEKRDKCAMQTVLTKD